MKYLNIKIIALLALFAVLSGCQDDPLEPVIFPNVDPSLKSITIAELKAQYTGSDVVLGAQRIHGQVISDSANKNIPKGRIIIQQGNSGIALDMGNEPCPFILRDSLVVDLRGGTLTKTNGALMITGLKRPKVQLIAYDRVPVVPKTVSVAEFNSNFSTYENTLVSISDKIFYAPSAGEKYSGSKVFSSPSGQNITLITEANASFANTVIPSAGRVTGIASAAGSNGSNIVPGLRMRFINDMLLPGALYAGFPEGAETINSAKTAYLPAESRTFGTGSWLLDNAVRQGSIDDKKNGSAAFRFPGSNTVPCHVAMNFNVPNGASKVEFKYANWQTALGGGTLQLEYSINNGTTWIKTGSDVVVNNNILQTASFIVNIDVPVRFRIKKLALGAGATNDRTNIDDIAIYAN